jgi:hypothetical protein
MRTRIDQPVGDVAGGGAGALAGIGILTMALFPFAVPALLLAAALAAPLLLPVVAIAIVAALLAGPVLAIRALARHVAGRLGRDRRSDAPSETPQHLAGRSSRAPVGSASA